MPSYISFEKPQYIEMEDKFCSGLYILDYAKKYNSLILKEILNLKIECYVNIYINKEDKIAAIKDITEYIGIGEVEKEKTKEEIDILSSVILDAKEIRRKLQLENDELHSICIYIMCKSKSKEELAKNIEYIKNKLFLSGMIAKKTNFRQKELFKVSMPLNNNEGILKEVSSRNILTSTLVGFYPFISNGIYDYKGILFGKEKYNNSLVLIDRFNREKYKNGNMCILGSSGSGKSFFTKLQIIRQRLYNTKQFVLDPEREYESISKYLKGTYIKFGKNTKTFINILDLNVESLKDKNEINNEVNYKLEKLKIFFLTIFENMDKQNYAYFEEKLKKLYYQSMKANKQILLEDVKYMMEKDEKLKKYSSLLNHFTKGSLSFFNKHTNVNLDNKLIVADLHDMEGDNLKYGLFLFLDFFWEEIKSDTKDKKIIYIDEIWKLIGASATKETAEYIYKLFKTIRKYNGSAVAITQDISDLFSIDNGKFGSTILNNSAFKALFSLNDENINDISKNIYLSDNEKILIRGLKKGESFIQAEREKVIIEIIANDLEKNIIEGGKNERKKANNVVI